MSKTVDGYIVNVSGDLQPVATRLRDIVLTTLPEAEEAIQWSRPTYRVNGNLVCYLAATKQHVALGFGQGRELSDPDDLLDGEGKQMAHRKHRSVDEIDEERLRGWLREAEQIALDS